jgi:hypothetical protein
MTGLPWRCLAAAGLLLTALRGVADAQFQQYRPDAQRVQVSPFYGYRFGGDIFEAAAGTPLDVDGAPSFGVSADFFVGNGQSINLLYSRQRARVTIPVPEREDLDADLTVDHWQVGGAQEVGVGLVRPFYGAGLGLTYFSGPVDTEVRFSIDVGGGVKLMPTRRVGVRLETRSYLVFVDGEGSTVCASGLCATRLHVSVAWQIEFTAGLVVAF